MSAASRKSPPFWQVLILTLPGRQPALRMRVWRRLRAAGAGVLRDGVYVFPRRADLEALARELADEVLASQGEALCLTVQAEAAEFQPMFDRSEDYQALFAKIATATDALHRKGRVPKAAVLDRLQREFDAISARDYFPTSLRLRAGRALAGLRAQLSKRRRDDEPHACSGPVARLDRADYRGRIWQSRARPFVDRLASAWLIRRFIDPQARFRWVAKPPAPAGLVVGFDYDGATFTHVGDKVTFEVLVESFGLQRHAALRRLAELVHTLDVGGPPVAEAAGVETLLRSMRERLRDDDALVTEASQLFDDLYASFAHPGAPSG